MCAWEPQSTNEVNNQRHIPVPALPTKPIQRCPMGSLGSTGSSLGSASSSASSTVTSGQLLLSSVGQPLNLSKRPMGALMKSLSGPVGHVTARMSADDDVMTAAAPSTGDSGVPTKA